VKPKNAMQLPPRRPGGLLNTGGQDAKKTLMGKI